MKQIATLLLIASALFGCNTVQGVGQDISAGGQVIEDSAQKTEEAITGGSTTTTY